MNVRDQTVQIEQGCAGAATPKLNFLATNGEGVSLQSHGRIPKRFPLPLRTGFGLLSLHSKRRAEFRLCIFSYVGEHLARQQCHVLTGEMIGQTAKLW